MRGFWRLAKMASTTTSARAPVKPLIAIVGATGTGKSELAVELAKRFNGEIINGDAMQLYAGLPIITNKVTPAEQQGIPHHLLGCISLNEPTWVVSTFVKRASKVIEEIRERGKLPILVGGTHYYTQSLLFREALLENKDDAERNLDTDMSPEDRWPVLAEPTDILLAELRKVDPTMAERWHPNDRRKIQRSLAIYLETGRPASEVYAEQELARSSMNHASAAEAPPSTPLRFPTLLFWVHSDPEILRERLSRRVHTMLSNGLLDEVDELSRHAVKELADGRPIDETRGIWVSIGFKEFQPYHDALATTDDEVILAKAKAASIEKTEIANRQYAKRQVRWIRIKLMESLAQAGARDDLYLLDSSNASRFEHDVVQSAADLTTRFLKGEARPSPSTLSQAAADHLSAEDECRTHKPVKRIVQRCDVCDLTCSTGTQWEAHLKSRKHRRLAVKQRKAEGSEQTKVDDDT